MATNHPHDDLYLDANGCPTERVRVGGMEILVHYADVPESDIATVDGIRVTTPIRTMIDLAMEVSADDLEQMVRTCLDRGLFDVDEALARLNQPDMIGHAGAARVRSLIDAAA